mmetsp:Transcript_97627/g.284996  ORF Transcript_97627/g.284996 Transcript_97627/m.284996 type:complete len:351 (+) Transcript_97627:119-1171(+)
MGDGDLPISGGLLEALFHPLLLLTPNLPHEVKAVLRRSWAAVACAVRIGWVVLLAADVVLLVDVRGVGIHRVGVEHEDLNAEVLVWELHALLEVLPGHDPAVTLPGVGDLLVPAVVKVEAAPVVVPEHTDPLLAGEPRTGVDALEDCVKLVLGGGMDGPHGLPASRLNSAKIEVVAYVEDVLGVVLRSSRLEHFRNEELWIVVHARHEAALTLALSSRPVAVHQVLVPALHPGPREDVGAGRGPAWVNDYLRVALPGHEGAVHATPISNGKDVGLGLGIGDGDLVPRDAIVAHAVLRRPPGPGVRLGLVCRRCASLSARRGRLQGASMLQRVQRTASLAVVPCCRGALVV